MPQPRPQRNTKLAATAPGAADRPSQSANPHLQALALPVTHEERELAVAASIGVALFPEHGIDAASLRHAADTAMYAAKQRGPGNTAFAGDLVAAE